MSPEDQSSAVPLSPVEFREYLVFHAHRLSARDLQIVAERLHELRAQFAELHVPQFPHTAARLGFLADLVEAFVAGRCPQMPFESVAEAAFALIYFQQQTDLLPDELPEIGFNDDAILTAMVLERNAPAYRQFARDEAKDWAALEVREPEDFLP